MWVDHLSRKESDGAGCLQMMQAKGRKGSREKGGDGGPKGRSSHPHFISQEPHSVAHMLCHPGGSRAHHSETSNKAREKDFFSLLPFYKVILCPKTLAACINVDVAKERVGMLLFFQREYKLPFPCQRLE